MSSFGFDLQADVQDSTADKILSQDCRGVHVFSFGSFDCYFWLDKAKSRWLTPHILELSGLPGRTTCRTFVFKATEADMMKLNRQLNTSVIHSLDELDIPNSEGKKFPEAIYHLPTVFDPSQYSREKRRLRLRYPINWLRTNRVTSEPITRQNSKEVADLHERWVERKLADPKTFKMMFPNKRYIKCCEQALLHPEQYLTWAFRWEGKIVAVHVYSVQGPYAFGLAGFGDVDNMPSNLMNYTVMQYFTDMKEKGIIWVNDGFTMNKGLTAYKSHYPHQIVNSYIYKRR